MLKIVLDEEGSALTLQLAQDLITIGRSKENVIIIKNKKASRAHAKIERIGGTYQITDLGSGNGTKVNGSKIDFHALTAGDEIRIGDATLTLKSIDDAVEDIAQDSADEAVQVGDLTDEPAPEPEAEPAAANAEGDDLNFKDEAEGELVSERETEIEIKPVGKPLGPRGAQAPKAGAPPAAKTRPSFADRFKKKKP
jgi:predicted component of type VI protein secretion system